MFISRRSFLSGMTAVWFHDVYTCVLLFVQMNMVPSGVYNLFSEVLADFFCFSHDVKQRGMEFEARPPIDSNDVN